MPELQQAITAVKSGDKATGKQLLIEIIKAKPNDEAAWLWMTQAVNTNQERLKCLQTVLKINPNNEAAKKGLAAIQLKQTSLQPSKVEAPPKPIVPLPEPETALIPSQSPVVNLAEHRVELRQAQAPPPVHRPLKTLKQEATKKCPYCAETIKVEAKFCRFCERDLITGQLPQAIVPQQPQVPIVIQAPPQRLWSPGVAAVLSLIIPGAGQMYKGEIGKGFLYLIITVIGYALFVIPGLILHLLCIIGAAQGNPYGQTNLIQSGTIQQTQQQKKGGNTGLIVLIGLGALVVFSCFFLSAIGQSVSKDAKTSSASITRSPTSTPRASSSGYVPIGGRIWTGEKVYYGNGSNKAYGFEVLGGSENCSSMPSGRGVKVRFPSGSEEWKDRDYLISSGLFFVLGNDPALSAMQWYEYDCW